MATTDIGPKNPAVKAGEAVVDYVDDRTGVSTGFKWFMFRNVPAETSWFQTLGFTAMALFGMQAVTGIILAMYYQPTAANNVALSPGFTALRLSMTTIIGLARPAAIRLSRIRSTCPCRYQPVSSSPHPCSR